MFFVFNNGKSKISNGSNPAVLHPCATWLLNNSPDAVVPVQMQAVMYVASQHLGTSTQTLSAHTLLADTPRRRAKPQRWETRNPDFVKGSSYWSRTNPVSGWEECYLNVLRQESRLERCINAPEEAQVMQTSARWTSWHPFSHQTGA